jgi:hypothetical protein
MLLPLDVLEVDVLAVDVLELDVLGARRIKFITKTDDKVFLQRFFTYYCCEIQIVKVLQKILKKI